MSSATLHRRTGRHAAPPPRRRDPWFDNAKMLLVLLVVVGHSWPLLPETGVKAHLYDWLYFWHMPAFLIVTGYLSKSFTYERRKVRRLVTTVGLPYLVFEGLLALFRVHVGGEEFKNLWVNPHWPMWFLAALFVWRLATPLLKRVPYAFPVAVALSLLGGIVGTEVLDTYRILGFLPFFVLGLVTDQRHLDLVRRRSTRLVGLVVLGAAVPLTWWFESALRTEWLYYRASYAELDASAIEGMATRLLLIGVAVAMSVSALAWIPQRGGWFTRMGAASLVVYLFHGFFIKGAEYAGVPDWAADHPTLSLYVVSAAAAVLALVLAWRPVAKPLEKVVTPDP